MSTNIRLDTITVRWAFDPSDGSESCVARAEVSYPVGDSGTRRLEWLTSGGLYGIGDPSDAHRRDVETQELDDLRDHLRVFGIDVRQFAQLAGRPDLQE